MGAPSSGKRSRMDGETILLWVFITAVVLGVGSVAGAVHLGSLLSNDGQKLPANPFELVFGLLSQKVTWPAAATWVLIGFGVLIILVAVLVVRAVLRRRSKRSRVDAAAQHMAKGQDLRALSLRGATATAERLGVKGSPGVPVGKTVLGGQMVYGSWEDMHIDIWGPSTGKTTSRAIPAILAAPGAALVTSNKRDIVDGTRDVRAAEGPVWVFDPQSVALEEPSWWWNPLSYVTDEVKAARLADHFAAGSRGPDAKTDAYFDPAGQDLLAGLLLAAALDGRPITQVHTWLTRPADDEAVDILKAHGFTQTSNAVGGVINAPEKQRGGVYGTALQMASCLTNRQVARWVTPQGDEGRAAPVRPGSIRPLQGHAVQPVQGRQRHRRPAGDGADRGHGRGRRRTRRPFARRPAGHTHGRCPGRSSQRLPLARAAEPLQPLRLPGHRPDDHPPVLVPRR